MKEMVLKENYFVKTSDPDTATYLREAGFPELAKEGTRWVFVNCLNELQNFDFSNNKLNDIQFNNKLTF